MLAPRPVDWGRSRRVFAMGRAVFTLKLFLAVRILHAFPPGVPPVALSHSSSRLRIAGPFVPIQCANYS